LADEAGMTEPAEVADRADVVVDGVWTWAVSNSNIGGATSSCQALAADGEVVLIDPLRLADHAFDELPRPTAIVLTAKCHQRSAWRYRSLLGVEVWAPADAPEADEQPDRRYAEGDSLPGRLRAIRTPGPERAHYCLVREAAPHVLFCSDLLMAGEDGRLEFVPARFHDDPAETRRSVERLLDVPFEVLCLDHGAPVTAEPKRAVREALSG
jgi:glyoxylase-like metal-dependent hydrolase (beta-lactamase superfamily II)